MVNRMKIFKHELDLIMDDEIKEFTIDCMKAAPEYAFIDCPSSSTGKYHPTSELGGDGNVLHSKRVLAVAYELCRGLDCEENRDAIIAAALLHDLAKQGLKKTGHTVKSHPQIMAKLIGDVYNDRFKGKIEANKANIIYWAVFYHYGPWTIQKDRKPLSEYTPEQLCVYVSDYTASKRFIHVQI